MAARVDRWRQRALLLQVNDGWNYSPREIPMQSEPSERRLRAEIEAPVGKERPTMQIDHTGLVTAITLTFHETIIGIENRRLVMRTSADILRSIDLCLAT